MIEYDNIHYYEKAGSIHYATSINAHYTGSESFGGSFTKAKISTSAAVIGGLLFGAMGMAIGAMATYKPAEYIPPKVTPSKFDMTSEITKIDDGSVILNYYSDQRKQFIDIELPQDIYNFIQTHLPTKKYDIVIELEKKDALNNTPTAEINVTNDIVARLNKLKSLYDMNLITEDEFSKRKNEILSEL